MGGNRGPQTRQQYDWFRGVLLVLLDNVVVVVVVGDCWLVIKTLSD